MKNIERIYITENGCQIDLNKIAAIGAIEKDSANLIYFNIYLTGLSYPLKFVAGHSLGTASETIKKNVQLSINKISNAWETYLKLTS